MGFASGESPPPKRMVFSSRGFPLHSEWDSLQRIPLVNSEWNSHQLRNPLQENGIRTKRVTLFKANGIRNKRVTLSKATGIRTKGSPSPSEWDLHQEGRPLQSEWDSLLTSGLVAARDPFQGTLLRGHATQGIPFSKGLRLCVYANGIRFKRFSFSQTTTFESGVSDSLRRRIHSELRLVILQLRDPIRGFLPPILIHLYNEIRKLKTHLIQAQLRP